MASSVKLASHNDYISQSQGCVVTLKGLKKQPPADDSQVLIRPKKETTAVSTDPVKVSLHDCLACSGCITTAETVMLEQQSTGVHFVGCRICVLGFLVSGELWVSRVSLNSLTLQVLSKV